MRVLSSYLTSMLLARFALLFFGLTAFMISLDLMVNSNNLMHHGGLESVARYALLRTPIVMSDFIKIAALLAGMLTFGSLIRHGELTAMWIAGVSQFGLFRRLLPIGLLLGGLQFAVDNVAAPPSVDALTDWGVGEYEKSRKANAVNEITWIHVGTDVVRVRTANIADDTLSDFTVFQRDDNGNLIGRLDVGSARYSGGEWQLSNITVTPGDGGPQRFEATRAWPISLNPDSLRHLNIHPRNLSIWQTWRFAGGDGQGTYAPYLYKTWLYEKLSTCLVPLLMLFLCAALAQQSQRGGQVELLFLVGAILGFAFFIFNGITLAMGEVGLLPPLFAALVPIVAFTAIAASVIYWHELKRRPA